MNGKRIWLIALLLCFILCSCGQTPAEVPTEAPAQESPLPTESSMEEPIEPSVPEVTEPLFYFIEGYSLEELGRTVSISEEFEAITDPNHTDERTNCFFEVHHNKQTEKLHGFASFLNGGFTEINISVAEDLAYNPYTMRLLQGYKLDELANEKDRVRLGDEYLTAAQLENYAIMRTDNLVICDLTDLYYSYAYSRDFAEATEVMGLSWLDYSWLIPVYHDLGEKIGEMIAVDHQSEEEADWKEIDPQEAEELWASYLGFWNGPKNRFVHFSYDDSGSPTLWWGLWDADGGRGYGSLIKTMKNSSGAVKIFIHYPGRPESEWISYTPAETVQAVILNIDSQHLNVQYADEDAAEFRKAGETFMEAYKAYSSLQ